MTCATFDRQFDAWLAGTLDEAGAREFERHAAECPACGTRLEAASRTGSLPRDIAPSPMVRDATLGVIARRRRARHWRQLATGTAAIAAAAAITVMVIPRAKSATGLPRVDAERLASARARPEFAELDAAERDVERELQDHPDDAGLTASLARIRRERDALQRLVLEARS